MGDVGTQMAPANDVTIEQVGGIWKANAAVIDMTGNRTVTWQIAGAKAVLTFPQDLFFETIGNTFQVDDGQSLGLTVHEKVKGGAEVYHYSILVYPAGDDYHPRYAHGNNPPPTIIIK